MSDARSSKELLDCPFCGSEARYIDISDDDGFGVAVECSWGACGVSTMIRYPEKEDGHAQVREAWNRRVRAADEPPAVDVAPIAKLTVRDGLVQRAGLYAPGLPDGDHDVYLEPIPAQPPSDVQRDAERWRAPNRRAAAMSNRDPLLAILRGLHDAVAALANTTHWAAERASESLAEVDRLLREQEEGRSDE